MLGGVTHTRKVVGARKTQRQTPTPSTNRTSFPPPPPLSPHQIGGVDPGLVVARNEVIGTRGRGAYLCPFCPKTFEMGPGNVFRDNAQGDVVDSRLG